MWINSAYTDKLYEHNRKHLYGLKNSTFQANYLKQVESEFIFIHLCFPGLVRPCLDYTFISQSQLEELRQRVGATLSERYTSQQKGTAKMMNDYEKMRKDLMKVHLAASCKNLDKI